ncbi:MAG: 2,3-bisphosphoglycerate-independent phosphoglycerate mutase [bacterium]
MKKPIALIILDGWGINKKKEGNAFLLAKKPNIDGLLKNYPSTRITASGKEVGLPEGQMGNSEVGHLNIGAGRIVRQSISRISESIKNGSFFKNKILLSTFNKIKSKNTNLHIMGLLSDGGVHSHIEHLFGLLDMAKQNGIKNVFIHCFLDGRDVSPTAGADYLRQLEKKLEELRIGSISTIMGRYYAMDRDKRWERIKLAYDAMVLGQGKKMKNAKESVEISYKEGKTDEFVTPVVLTDNNNNSLAKISDGDTVIFYNFRPDRARQITKSLISNNFIEFERKIFPKVDFVCFTEYEKDFNLPVVFQTEDIKNGLGEIISKAGLKQLRIAETEKYAHVTFFFNGGREKIYSGEDRCLIPSSKVPTYDMKPEMSAFEVTKELIKRIESDIYDFIVLNYANFDMVGHTGNLNAAIAAVEAVDTCLGQVVDIILKKEGIILLTGDHGNIEEMIDDETSEIHTAHTTNPVPLVFIGEEKLELKPGILADMAPTILGLFKLEKPKEMTGENLIK